MKPIAFCLPTLLFLNFAFIIIKAQSNRNFKEEKKSEFNPEKAYLLYEDKDNIKIWLYNNDIYPSGLISNPTKIKAHTHYFHKRDKNNQLIPDGILCAAVLNPADKDFGIIDFELFEQNGKPSYLHDKIVSYKEVERLKDDENYSFYFIEGDKKEVVIKYGIKARDGFLLALKE